MCAKRRTAIKSFAALALGMVSGLAWAAPVVGTVVNLSGPLMVRKADGVVKVLALRSEVEQGDTLLTEKNTYARVKFIDNSEVTLKPGTTFRIEAFSYEAAKPEGDSASFNLLKGGLRSVSGLLGQRNKEKFQLKTPTATIGIRGTTFIAEFVEDDATAVAARQAYWHASSAGLDAAPLPAAPLLLAQNTPPRIVLPGEKPSLAPGLYVHIIDGLINLTNKGGVQSFSAGQFGFTPSAIKPPVVLPVNPGLLFLPPPSFSASVQGNAMGGTNKAQAVDCEVR